MWHASLIGTEYFAILTEENFNMEIEETQSLLRFHCFHYDFGISLPISYGFWDFYWSFVHRLWSIKNSMTQRVSTIGKKKLPGTLWAPREWNSIIDWLISLCAVRPRHWHPHPCQSNHFRISSRSASSVIIFFFVFDTNCMLKRAAHGKPLIEFFCRFPFCSVARSQR